jgi:hypothetical protein
MFVVDPWEWLDKDGNPPVDNPRRRRLILRVARFIEYGGPLESGDGRETLLECRQRPRGNGCQGLLWVHKAEDDTIFVFCRVCGKDEAAVHNWQHTEWAAGMMQPVPSDPSVSNARQGGPGNPRTERN